MKKLILIILLAITGLSAGSSNHATEPKQEPSEQIIQSVDETTAKVDKLLVRLKQTR